MSDELLNISFYGEAPSSPTTSTINSFSRNQEVPMTPILGRCLEISQFQIVPFTHNDSLGTPTQEVTPNQSLNRSFQVAPISRNESIVITQANLSTPYQPAAPLHPKIYDDQIHVVPSSANKSSITFNPRYAILQHSSSNYFVGQINRNSQEAPTNNFIQQINQKFPEPTNNCIQQSFRNSQDELTNWKQINWKRREQDTINNCNIKQINWNRQKQATTNNCIKETNYNSNDEETTNNFISQTNGNSQDQGPTNNCVQQISQNSQNPAPISTSNHIGSGDGLVPVEIEVNGRDIQCSSFEGENLHAVQVHDIYICSKSNEATTSSQHIVRNEISPVDVKTKPQESTRIKRTLLPPLGGCGDSVFQSGREHAVKKSQRKIKTSKNKGAAFFDNLLLADSDEELFAASNHEGLGWTN